MGTKLIIGLVLLLVLISGCQNSYQSCKEDCVDMCLDESRSDDRFTNDVGEIIEKEFEMMEDCYDLCHFRCRGLT